MSKLIRDFTELRVYGDAFRLALKIYETTGGWPRTERYGLTDQIRRSSRSVCANIAEAWFKRRYPKHFASKLTDASAEAAETMVFVEFARHHHYITPEDADSLEQEYRKVISGLVSMISRPKRWCAMPTTIRDPEEAYRPT